MLNITEQQIAVILEALKDCFFDNLTQDTYYENVLEYCDRSVFCIDAHDNGVTKLVLMPKECDFVIKIPFLGGGDWDEKSKKYIRFSGAAEPEGWNYCKVENILYSKAKTEEVEEYFLETRCIGFVKGYPIYAQELASTFSELRPKKDFNKTEIRDFCRRNNTRCFNVTWIKDFISFYGEEAWLKLSNFIDCYGVCDLHSANIGYNTMGAPVIMDYAGYSD